MTGRQKLTVLVVLGGLALLLGGWEAYTLAFTDAPDDHITASFRALSKTDLGLLILLGVVGIIGVIAGHVWNRWGGPPPPAAGGLVVLLALLSGGCALLKPAPLACKPCWVPAPCEHPWISVDNSAGGGCLLIVPKGQECPVAPLEEE